MSDGAIDTCHAAGCRNEVYVHSWKPEDVCGHCKPEEGVGKRFCTSCVEKGVVWCASCEIEQLKQQVALLLRSSPLPGQHRSDSLYPVKDVEYILVQPGKFLMGFDQDEEGLYFARNEHSVPVHWVLLCKPFLMKKNLVTQAEWSEVMGENPSLFKSPKRPVERVSWLDAIRYCNELSKKEGIEPAYTVIEKCNDYGTTDVLCVKWDNACKGYRLPMEAEWEYACRAGCTKHLYGVLNAIAWYSGNSNEQTHPVGEMLPNNFGLYDMMGNVLEFTFEPWRENYSCPAYVWGTDIQTPELITIRGSSWDSDPGFCYIEHRAPWPHNEKDCRIGFRVCRYI